MVHLGFLCPALPSDQRGPFAGLRGVSSLPPACLFKTKSPVHSLGQAWDLGLVRGFSLAEGALHGLYAAVFTHVGCRAPPEGLHGTEGAENGQPGVTVSWGHVNRADAKAL